MSSFLIWTKLERNKIPPKIQGNSVVLACDTHFCRMNAEAHILQECRRAGINSDGTVGEGTGEKW